MIEKEELLPLTRELQKRLGLPFAIAEKCFSIRFSEADIKYIETNIKKHKLYRALYKQGYNKDKHSEYDKLYRWQIELNFCNMFLKDQTIPIRVKDFLNAYIGLGLDTLENYNYLQYSVGQRFLIEKWMETCR